MTELAITKEILERASVTHDIGHALSAGEYLFSRRISPAPMVDAIRRALGGLPIRPLELHYFVPLTPRQRAQARASKRARNG